MVRSEFQQFIASNTWIFAKTYASFCPHEYIVKDRLPIDEQSLFEKAVSFIRESGFVAIYGRKAANRYYIVDGHYYWTMGEALAETNILNRAKLADYEFITSEDGITIKYRNNK